MRSAPLRCALAFAMAMAVAASLGAAESPKLLNASYDVAREFYKDYNAAFARHWAAGHGGATPTIDMSHGGSSKQARAVIDGLEADVVTMNQSLDIDRIAEAKLLPADWATRLPDGSAPNSSTILFLVRAGNPKGIRDWNDLAKPGVKIVVPNPKTSGNGRYSYLAALAWAKRANGGDEAKARAFLGHLFANAPVLDTGGRGATTTFAQRGIGDALLTFECEVQLIRRENPDARLEVVVPSVSIVADNPVAWVDAVVAKHGTQELAKAYLEWLYSPEAQEIAAAHGIRPRDTAILAKHAAEFATLQLVTVDEVAGGWAKAEREHFADGGVFDQLTGGQ